MFYNNVNKGLVFLTQLLSYFTLFYMLPYATHTHTHTFLSLLKTSCFAQQTSKYVPWIKECNAQSKEKSEKELLCFKTSWTMMVTWVKLQNERENERDKERMPRAIILYLRRYTFHWHLLHWRLTFQTQYEIFARNNGTDFGKFKKT